MVPESGLTTGEYTFAFPVIVPAFVEVLLKVAFPRIVPLFPLVSLKVTSPFKTPAFVLDALNIQLVI